MEWVAVLLVPIFAVLGSIYCLWIIWAGWKEARSARAELLQAEQGFVNRSRALADILVVTAELGLAAAFVIGAVLVASETVHPQVAAWRQATEANVRCKNCLDERFFHGPNDSRLVVHFADALPNRPVVFVDSTCQPIGDGDLAELAKRFPATRDLLLGRTRLTDAGLPELRRFKHLDSLSLQGLPITDRGLKHLALQRDLTFLDVSATSVSDEGLKFLIGLPRLEELRLCSTQVSDAGLVHLRGHQNLKLLALTDTAVTKQGIAELQKALPACTIEQKTVVYSRQAYSLARK